MLMTLNWPTPGNRMPIIPLPDLFGLIEATSNEGSCALITLMALSAAIEHAARTLVNTSAPIAAGFAAAAVAVVAAPVVAAAPVRVPPVGETAAVPLAVEVAAAVVVA